MMMFEEMGFCGDMDMSSAPLGEGGVVTRQTEPEVAVEDDYSDEEIDVDVERQDASETVERTRQIQGRIRYCEAKAVPRTGTEEEDVKGPTRWNLEVYAEDDGSFQGSRKIEEKGKPVTGASDNL